MKIFQLKLLIILLFSSGLTYAQVDDDEIFTIVQDLPRFPGCEDIEGTYEEKKQCAEEKTMAFIIGNIQYPKIAKANRIQGRVIVRFIVEKDGSITNAEVSRYGGSLGGGCNQEAIRIVNEMPKWIPGTHRGKPVRVRYNLPVKFELKDNKPKKVRKETITFTLNNNTRSTYRVSTPRRWITFKPGSVINLYNIPKGYQVMYAKKSKKAKPLLTVTKDLRGKRVEIKSFIKKAKER